MQHGFAVAGERVVGVPGHEVKVLAGVLRFVCRRIVYGGRALSTVSKTFVNKFGANVRALREERELSQEELAAKAKLHRTHISLIERGKRQAGLETIEALAKALQVQPADLMPTVK